MLEFTEATSRHWRLSFCTGTGGLYEVYLSKLLLDFDTAEKRPVWRAPRHKGLFERAASGDLLNFQPLGFGGGRADISLKWTSLDEASVTQLRQRRGEIAPLGISNSGCIPCHRI